MCIHRLARRIASHCNYPESASLLSPLLSTLSLWSSTVIASYLIAGLRSLNPPRMSCQFTRELCLSCADLLSTVPPTLLFATAIAVTIGVLVLVSHIRFSQTGLVVFDRYANNGLLPTRALAFSIYWPQCLGNLYGQRRNIERLRLTAQ